MLSKNSTTYVAHYDSTVLRGKDDSRTPRPWNLQEIIIEQCANRQRLLDIGCGTAFKLFPISSHIDSLYGLDPSDSMIQSAKIKISSKHLNNIQLVRGQGEYLPFQSGSMDIITCMLSRWKISEIHRVLDKKGIVIVEHIGCEDKKSFKELFGKDEKGWRGQFIEFNLESYLEGYEKLFSNYFETVSIRNGYWDTYYTLEGIYELLNYTPTIRNYNYTIDQASINEAVKLFSSSKGIKLTQNRILICAQNPRFFKI